MELKDLKVGDKVIVHYNYSEDIKYVSRITKVKRECPSLIGVG